MKKADYLRECLKRNPNLKKDILTFHQKFPSIFSCERGKQTPDWLKSILEPVSGLKDSFGNDLYVGRPKKIEDLRILHNISIQKEGFRILMIGEGKYWEVINKKPIEYTRAFQELVEKWPSAHKSTFIHGVFEPYRPSILISSIPFESMDWRRELERLGEVVKIVIPIYEDTSSDDVDWKQIASLQNFIHGVKKRSTRGKYELKLKVWDTYQQEGNFTIVANLLKKPRTTIESLYKSAHKDIIGTAPHGKLKERRAVGIDASSHIAECSRCQNAKTFEQMCPGVRAYVTQDYVSQRELTVGGLVETYIKSHRKKLHPGADKYLGKGGEDMFKKEGEMF